MNSTERYDQHAPCAGDTRRIPPPEGATPGDQDPHPPGIRPGDAPLQPQADGAPASLGRMTVQGRTVEVREGSPELRTILEAVTPWGLRRKPGFQHVVGDALLERVNRLQDELIKSLSDAALVEACAQGGFYRASAARDEWAARIHRGNEELYAALADAVADDPSSKELRRLFNTVSPMAFRGMRDAHAWLALEERVEWKAYVRERRRDAKNGVTHSEDSILCTRSLLHEGARYAEKTLGCRWPRWEEKYKYIRKPSCEDVRAILSYTARFCAGDRWKKAEKLLLAATVKACREDLFDEARAALTPALHEADPGGKDCRFAAVDYARDVIGGGWPELADIILAGGCHPLVGVDYADRILKTRWPDFEALILGKPPTLDLFDVLYSYSARVVGGEWQQAGDYVSAHSSADGCGEMVVRCAEHVIKGRWRRGEAALLANPSVRKALDFNWECRGGGAGRLRFEDIHSCAAVDYARDVIGGEWPELADMVLAGGCHPLVGVDYADRIMKTRWPDFEASVLGEATLPAGLVVLKEYADRVVKGRLPGHLHTAMVLLSSGDSDEEEIKSYIRRHGV
jgi:hypothetical protein